MTDKEREELKKKFPFAYGYIYEDDFEHPEEARVEMILLRRDTELWDKIEDDDYVVNTCPPRTMEMSEGQLETRCFGGCKMCWDDCEKDDFDEFLKDGE